MVKYEVNNNSIQSLLAWIRAGEIALPEIQRPFVWKPAKVRDLIDSIYQGFPVGYLIIWRSHDVKLKDGTSSIGKKILIDGQQRLTALQAAIVGQEVIGSDFKKKRIAVAFNPLTEEFQIPNAATLKDSRWIPDIAPLFMPGFDAFNFVIEYCARNNLDNSQRSAVNNIVKKLQQLQNNVIGVIELSPELDINQVTEIFIRINSKGVPLSQADFAMSKIASDELYDGKIIRKVIDYFCRLIEKPEDFENIVKNDAEFASGEYFPKIKWIADEAEKIYAPDYSDVLRTVFAFRFLRGRLEDLVSLLSGRDFESKEYLAEISQKSFAQLLDGVLAFTNQTNFMRFLMIVRSTGIITPKLVRSQHVLNFAYALYLLLRSKKIDQSIIEKLVRRWIVISMLTQRYSGSPESQFDADIKSFDSKDPVFFIREIESGELSEAFWNNLLVSKLDTSSSTSPFYNVFLMAMIKLGSRGFLSEHIDIKSLVEQNGEVHHIFPKNYLIKSGIKSSNIYNSVANYAYTQGEINNAIKDKAPKDYLALVQKQCVGGELKIGGISDRTILEENLEENCIPSELFEMDYSRYEEFLSKRRKLMAAKIEKYYKIL